MSLLLPKTEAPEIETRRLRLRQMHASDEAAFHSVLSDKQVVDQTSWPLCATLPEARDVMNQMNSKVTNGSGLYWGIASKHDDQLIGYIGLTNFSNTELRSGSTFAIATGQWGLGYASEALVAAVSYGFTTVGLNRIQAYVFVDNPASAKVLSNSGFQLEGRHRDYFRDHRGFHDLELFAILHRDFTAAAAAVR